MSKKPARHEHHESHDGEAEVPIENPTIISPTSVKLAEVVTLHAEVFNADELSVLNSAVVELQAYEASQVVVAAPVNVDAPHASQVGSVLSCTMGNWEGMDAEPHSYSYQWTVGGGAYPASDVSDHPVSQVDVGLDASCVVTATNAGGSTVAPASNVVVVADPQA